MARIVAEHLPQLVNVKAQVRFLDKSVGPEAIHQRFLLNNPAAVLNQNQQHVKDLRCELERLAPAQQDFLVGVDREISERVKLRACRGHNHPGNASKTFLRTFKSGSRDYSRPLWLI